MTKNTLIYLDKNFDKGYDQIIYKLKCIYKMIWKFIF